MDLIKLAKLNSMRIYLEECQQELKIMEEKYKFNKQLYKELYELMNTINVKNQEDYLLIEEINEIKWTNKKAKKDIRLFKRKIKIFYKNVLTFQEKIEKEIQFKKSQSYQKQGLYLQGQDQEQDQGQEQEEIKDKSIESIEIIELNQGIIVNHKEKKRKCIN